MEGIAALTDREKDVLRMLSSGHTAKSAAAELDLSVHTVNDYLREARKKLGVGSSREAARLLAEREQPPENLGHQQIGMAQGEGIDNSSGRSTGAFPKSRSAVLIAGGLIVLAGTIALLLATGIVGSDHPADAKVQTMNPQETEIVDAARDWVRLVDAGQYGESWTQAGATFRGAVTRDQWEAQVKPVREPLGEVGKRTVRSVTTQINPPGAPAGEYRTIQFDTYYSGAGDVIETVVLMDENGSWEVVGYFVRPSM